MQTALMIGMEGRRSSLSRKIRRRRPSSPALDLDRDNGAADLFGSKVARHLGERVAPVSQAQAVQQGLQRVGEGLAKLGDAVKAKSEVTTSSGKTLRARKVRRTQ